MMDNLKLPFYLEAEQSILGIIFLDPKKILIVMDRLSTEDFFNLEHQYIYEAMKTLIQEQKDIDYFSVNSVLEKKNKKLSNGLKYLFQLTNNIPSIYHLDSYIDFVYDASLKREVITTISGIYNEGISNQELDFENYLNIAEEKLFQISKKKKNTTLIDIKTLLKEVENKTYHRRDNKIIGLSTGFPYLDDITLGFKPEELIILAARPSMGKSSFMSELALNIVRKNKKKSVIIFSLEMSNEQLCTRMLSSQSKIDHKKIQLGILNQREIDLLKAVSLRLQNYNIFFNDSFSANLLDIRSQCRKMKNQNKLDIVIIDYLQLIGKNNKNNYKNFNNRQEEIAEISKGLKQMAKELKVPVLALSQLSREVEKREDKRPILSDLRDSGSIEQDADLVMFLYRPDYYDKNKKEISKMNYTELIISKNRQGATGKTQFLFNLNDLSFQETEKE
ncbi:MAG: replicative DNA helicase [Candidatus Phytoplasma stylosanthis]|nr:replicative DNA helicase [Candidatus Phytoplasma stylosanthis]MDV3170740.1 replicative DNA helicase [Candidatus Phytoplasma stylosanthis]MDV3173616.1 replicative DNA helicase [Candidatus Phytoplasma stylosanthis]MDV3173997.1 replicative DNA helicase [Candidatus Phytoplasma stylosanthis]MDV3202591.1 replicative DNA helicase [Candidatus Phytoplasma stylosanthis]